MLNKNDLLNKNRILTREALRGKIGQLGNCAGLAVENKDEDKENNYAGNLEWCDHKYNSNYGTRGERIGGALSRAIYSVDEYGNIEHFKSFNDAQRLTGIFATNIRCSITGVYSKAGNRKWYYENSQITNND